MQFHEHTHRVRSLCWRRSPRNRPTPWLFPSLRAAIATYRRRSRLPQRTQRLTTLRAQQAALETELTTVFWAAEAHGLVLPPPEIAAAAMLGLTP